MPLLIIQKEKYLSSNALLPAADLSEQVRPFTANNHKKVNILTVFMTDRVIIST